MKQKRQDKSHAIGYGRAVAKTEENAGAVTIYPGGVIMTPMETGDALLTYLFLMFKSV